MMTMMDYGSQFTGSTISSDTMSGSTGSVQPRIRTIRLVRPYNGTLPPPGVSARLGPNLGFSVRGGREHGTGFFVSVVEPGSAAHRQGLKVGDQIIRINGFTIEDAVHKEVLQLISNHTHLILKVRSVGMIPVKESTEPLNWQIISDSISSTRSSPQLNDKIHDVRLNIIIAPRSKLGCGICKGPDWKPGIFVQYTKEGGIARETGLRPGDQIISCNNVDFNDIQFNEAVDIMKSSRQLNLVIRKSAGSELFPSESSGYNSSASSVTGDQSPSWSDSKRLSIVKEETHDLEDRLSQLDRLKSMKWDRIEWENGCTYKPTIINVPGNDSITSDDRCQNVESNTSNPNKLAEICLISQQQETKTVVVEVHKGNVEAPPKRKISPSVSSSSAGSLTSAIAQEFHRRCDRANSTSAITKPSIDEQLQKQKVLKGVDTDKQQQHTRLMDEFKKVHRRMFKSTLEEEVEDVPAQVEKETCTDRQTNNKIAPTPVERRSTLAIAETLQEKLTRSISAAPGVNGSSPPPPPPLPPQLLSQEIQKPQINGTNFQAPPPPVQPTKTKVAPPVPTKYSTLSYLKDLKDKNPHIPPPCPPPDYDTISINSSNNVEMDSLDSFRLNNPTNLCPKPPNNYFTRPKSMLAAQLSNGSTSSNSSRNQRPVSVTIGEYPSGSLRKQPKKLDFLNSNGERSDDSDRSSNSSMNSQFTAELTNTLNRSNLRRQTESMENLLDDAQIKSQSNGSVTISLNRNFAKSINSLNELCAENISNRVTINILSDKKEDGAPNGILKNGNGNHKPLAQQKSITFGEMPTVINDLLKVS